MQNSILLSYYGYQTEELSSKLTFIKGREESLIFYEKVAEDETMLFVIVHECMLDLERET